MGYDTHIARGHRIVFGLMIFFSIIELSISAWLTAQWNSFGNQNNNDEVSRTHFLLFCSVWTIVFSIAYLGLFLHSRTGSIATSIASHGIFLFFTWLWWTAGAAAITSTLGGGLNCGNTDYGYCPQLNAEEGFAWIMWILVTFALVVVIIRGIGASRSGDGMRGSLVDA